jgi:hypothetical protein
MVEYVMGKVTLKKMRDVCKQYGFTRFRFQGRIIELCNNLDNRQYQVFVTNEKLQGTGRQWQNITVWPDEFRRWLEEKVPAHVASKVETHWDIPRLVLVYKETKAMREERLRMRRVDPTAKLPFKIVMK